MEKQEFITIVNDIIEDITFNNARIFEYEDYVEKLNFDDLDCVEFIMAIEEEFNIDLTFIDDEDIFHKYNTLNKLYEFVKSLV